MTTTINDIHPDIIQTHILPRLDGPSLSTTATSSSYLNTLCSDNTLWSRISRSTWPLITHPRIDAIISTFPSRHRSFFNDTYPTLFTHVNQCTGRNSSSSFKSDRSSWPSELISAVDIRYLNDIIYSIVNFTKTTYESRSSQFQINLNEDPACNLLGPDPTRERPGSDPVHEISKSIDLKVDEIVGADLATVSRLKECMTLNWIIIDPVLKRACNISSVKPVSVKAGWATNETHVRYATVLPGCDNEMVQCKIHVVLGVRERGVGLKVNKVMLKLSDLDSRCLNVMEFMVITKAAIMGENNVTRKVVDDHERVMSYKKFKEMKKDKKVLVKMKQRKREVVVDFGFVVIFISFFISFYIVILR